MSRRSPLKQAVYPRQTIGSVSYEYDENNRLIGIKIGRNYKQSNLKI